MVVQWNFLHCPNFERIILYIKANNEDCDQALGSVTFDQGLHCLPMSHKKDANGARENAL